MKKSRYEALYDSLIDALNHRKATDLEKTEKIKHQASVEVALRIDRDRLNVLLSDKESSYNALGEAYDLARSRIAELEKMLDQACTRDEDNHRAVEQLAKQNQFYSDLLYEMTGNRNHEIAETVRQQADQVIAAVWDASKCVFKPQIDDSVEESGTYPADEHGIVHIPQKVADQLRAFNGGKGSCVGIMYNQADAQQTVFCKSAIGLKCTNPSGEQCTLGECRRDNDRTTADALIEAMRPVPKVCEHCGRPIGRGPGMCHGSCDLPF